MKNYDQKISIIVVADENNAIGKNNELLCHLPNDLKHFKQVTSNHTVIMGSNTFKSLPKGALPNRTNIVLTSNTLANFPGCLTAHSIEKALELCKDDDEVFFIGGGKVYKSAISIANRIYLTRIHHTFENADTFFPEITGSDWILTEETFHLSDEKNPFNHTFQLYIRNTK
ncbi:MAG: dihydrofolate reductase [Dysgonamonadaceae bacterium]